MKSTVISKFLNQTKSHVNIVIVQTFLFRLLLNLSMDDFNFEKDPFTRESTTIRTRLKKWGTSLTLFRGGTASIIQKTDGNKRWETLKMKQKIQEKEID